MWIEGFCVVQAPAARVLADGQVFWITASLPNRDEQRWSRFKGQASASAAQRHSGYVEQHMVRCAVRGLIRD